MDKAIIKEKKIEAVIGFIFLLPAVIGVICFVVNLCTGGDSCKLNSLSGVWESYGEAAENTPVYFGLMAIAGAYMLKNSLRYLFLKEEKPEETNKTNN
ncbi:MAG: hypothetical protein ACI30M_02710 [Muribaculaceae bacterium]